METQRNFRSKGVEQMDAEAAKYIGAGIACLGMGGAGIGLGNIFGSYLSGALRNPSAADGQFGRLIFGFAVTEALGIFSNELVRIQLVGCVRYNCVLDIGCMVVRGMRSASAFAGNVRRGVWLCSANFQERPRLRGLGTYC
jgi:F-type H+-transporting ATPase subunit c